MIFRIDSPMLTAMSYTKSAAELTTNFDDKKSLSGEATYLSQLRQGLNHQYRLFSLIHATYSSRSHNIDGSGSLVYLSIIVTASSLTYCSIAV